MVVVTMVIVFIIVLKVLDERYDETIMIMIMIDTCNIL